MRTVKLFLGSYLLGASLFLISSCGNEGSDSVATADSINREEQRVADSLSRNNPSEESARFLVRAANSGMTEVMASKLASERATRKSVKDIARMLSEDHHSVNNEVKSLAQQRNVTLPDSISESSRKDYNDLVTKRGTDFDKEFVNQMIDDHQDDIKLFEDALNDANDVEIRSFAQNTLPKLRDHLEKLKVVKDGIR